ncbi:putative 115 kDa protein in type-1 retrotransposable element R1DM [Trichonephila clavipes]|nr:putative 115 kDa protein in type-1 retrotransposable element R1DM [Trichonephila clavipes]
MQLGSTSAIRCLERGCPQGSVSGPIFWNIIINDLLSKLNNLACCEIIAFADDILVCSQGRDLSATFLHAQEALNFASDWSKSFKLDFNPDKTRFMAIEKRNVCYDAFQLYLDGTPLTMVKQMKYLGVLLDTKFSWKQHLSYISERCDKLQRGLNRIARNTFEINFNVHSLIYKQGIEPFILYGSRVWGEALKRKMNSKYLLRIQRRILLRVICGYRTISYDSVYAISGFPPINITILHDITFKENLSASSISNYDCILSSFFIPHPSERNAINIVQFSDKSTEDFPVICCTDSSKIDFAFGYHTRFTHRRLLFGEHDPECPSCKVSYTVRHILIDCPVFNHYRITLFHTSILTLSDLVGEIPHQNLFAFSRKIGFLHLS